MANPEKNCGIVILAAGESSRLGRPKQLLLYKGATLLGHAIHTAMETDCGPVLVVTGANHEKVTEYLPKSGEEVVQNHLWQEGMASSIRTGLQAMLEAHPETDRIIIMVCDQPFVTKSGLLCLINQQLQTGKAITASSYGGKAGTPALFHRSVFGMLMELKGDKGARILIANHPELVTVVPFEKGTIDIDTETDYEQLLIE